MLINLDKTKKYLLACSYGPDSMALFSLLLDAGITFSVAHVNYQMRGSASEKETQKLEAYAKKHNIPFYSLTVEGRKYSGNFQRKAREERYEFFRNLVKNEAFDALLTAHHKDDHFETYLMQKESKRKAFYYGIRPAFFYHEMQVLRPLINVSKKEIMDYVKTYDVPYALDASNNDFKYTRNRIRAQIVGKKNEKERNALDYEIRLHNKRIQIIEQKVTKIRSEQAVVISAYYDLNQEEKEFLLYTLFAEMGIATFYSQAKAKNIENLVGSRRSSLIHKVKDNIYFVKYEEKFRFINIMDYKPYEYHISRPQTLVKSHFIVYLDEAIARPSINVEEYPILITSPRKGDEYHIKDYRKTVNRLFIDMKLPPHYRLIWPVVRNQYGKIIYIPRYQRDYQQKTTDLFVINLKI